MNLISIIITTYKGETTIVDCVSSALAQDYSLFEVIVVDDNGIGSESQVKTYELLEPFISLDNFKYIPHDKNINGSAARNTGIKNAKGEYIAFLDDDDLLHHDSIRKRFECLSNHSSEYGVVFSSFSQFMDGKKDFDCIFTFDGDILYDYLLLKIHSPSSVLMMPRATIDCVGLWDEDFNRHQDWEYLTRILSKYKACSIPDVTVDRIVTWRNNAKNPELFEKQRLYYLSKMAPIINSFNEMERDAIYYTHYIDIGKNYLKYYRFNKAIYYAIKSKHFFKAISLFLKDASIYFFKKIRRK